MSDESSFRPAMMRIRISVPSFVNMNVHDSLLAATSAVTWPAWLAGLGLALAAVACRQAFLRGRRNGLGMRNRRLDAVGHRLQLGDTLWRVETSDGIVDVMPDLCMLSFRQKGSRLVAVGEESDGRQRWFEGVVTGHRLALCEVSRVQRGFHVATILLRQDPLNGTLVGMRQVLLPDGSLELQQITLVPMMGETHLHDWARAAVSVSAPDPDAAHVLSMVSGPSSV